MYRSLMDLLMTEHYTSLTAELKCACNTFLEPPILLCKKGHGSCKRCRRRYQCCSTCKEPFTETRSVALEALVDKLQYPCENPGCKTRIPISQIEEHSRACQFRATPCLMERIYGGCNWKGLASEWLDHCLKDHSDSVTDLPFVTFSEPWSPKHRDPVMKYHLLRCYEKVFNVYQIYDSKSGKMMWTVIATGESTPESKTFYFEVEFFNPENPLRKISFRQPCKTENDADILEPSQNVLISLDQVLFMLDSQKRININLVINESSKVIATESHEELVKVDTTS